MCVGCAFMRILVQFKEAAVKRFSKQHGALSKDRTTRLFDKSFGYLIVYVLGFCIIVTAKC